MRDNTPICVRTSKIVIEKLQKFSGPELGHLKENRKSLMHNIRQKKLHVYDL